MAVEVIRKLSLVVFVWRILRDGDNIYIYDVESFVNYKSTRHIRTNFVKDILFIRFWKKRFRFSNIRSQFSIYICINDIASSFKIGFIRIRVIDRA